jgi:hypothetical protein
VDSTIWAAIIASVGSLIIFTAGGAATSLRDRAAGREATAAQARTAVQELVRAALDLQGAMALWETRYRDKRSMVSAIARSLAQMLAGHAEDRTFRGAAEGLGSAMAWRQATDAAAEAIVMGPMSRMTAAAAQIAMLNDRELRMASSAVTDAMGKVVTAYADRPRRGVRESAARELEEAIGRLGEAARAYDGRPRRRLGGS